MNSRFFNKLEIMLYSTLISVMSGINHLKPQAQLNLSASGHSIYAGADGLASVYVQTPERSASLRWESIQQVFLSLLLWVVLGFAAGFLLGMINSW